LAEVVEVSNNQAHGKIHFGKEGQLKYHGKSENIRNARFSVEQATEADIIGQSRCLDNRSYNALLEFNAKPATRLSHTCP